MVLEIYSYAQIVMEIHHNGKITGREIYNPEPLLPKIFIERLSWNNRVKPPAIIFQDEETMDLALSSYQESFLRAPAVPYAEIE